jgi:hypothetical protein
MKPAVLLLLVLATPLAAAGISGKWTGQMSDSGRDVVFNLKSDGSKVTGTMSGPEGEPRPITQGEVKDGEVSLTVASECQGQPVKLLVKGKIEGKEMKITLSSENGEWSTDITLKKAD